jgi:hypothetical protein
MAGIEATEALNPIPPGHFRIGYGTRCRHLLLFTGQRLDDFYDGRHKRGKGFGPEFTGRGGRWQAYTHLRFSQDVCCTLDLFLN